MGDHGKIPSKRWRNEGIVPGLSGYRISRRLEVHDPLLVRVKHEECQQFIRDIEQTKEAFLAMGSAPEEKVLAMKLYAFLLHSMRQKYDAVERIT
jgi:hypothetical protein